MNDRANIPTIGLTGGIGAGKSAVADVLRRAGCIVSDSDRDTAEILADPKVVDTIRGWWGDDVVDGDGTIVRKMVAKRVFEDPTERRRLENLIHPQVHARRRIRFTTASSSTPAFVIDAPLLFEAGLDAECDAVWFVDAPLDVRRGRVRVNRGWDVGELERREANQISIDEKRRRSDRVLENRLPLESLESTVADALTEFLDSGSKA